MLNMNNHSYLFLSVALLSFTTSIPAQTLGQMTPLDDAYLASLPEGLRQQMLGQAAEPDEETDYANPDTRTEKLESALKDAEATLAKIKEDIEKNRSSTTNLKRFGADFFSSIQ